MKNKKITSDKLADLLNGKAFEKMVEEHKNKVPIYKGCPNKVCYCTGACHEIIGYRDRLPGEEFPNY